MIGRSTHCKNCGKVIKLDRWSRTGWRHASSDQTSCEPRGDAEPPIQDKPARKS